MAVTREYPIASRTSRIVLGLTVATCLCAAVAAAPSAPTSLDEQSAIARTIKASAVEDVTGVRPLGRGPAIRVGRAYDAEDEDCTLVVTQTTDEQGHVHVTRGVACAN
jgi:hypothetical protein